MRALRQLAHAPGLAGLGLVYAYRYTLGALFPATCKYHPSCSQYALDAIRIHGATRGSLMAIWRIARCGPLTAGGVDQVPARRSTIEMYDSVTPESAS